VLQSNVNIIVKLIKSQFREFEKCCYIRVLRHQLSIKFGVLFGVGVERIIGIGIKL